MLFLFVLAAGPAGAAPPLTRAQALAALDQPQAARRLEGVQRLAAIGIGSDADRLMGRLSDDDPQVREEATAAIWRVWGRSGDAAIDRLFARGLAQMEAGDVQGALATFSDVVRRKPAFTEAWNKRATLAFIEKRDADALADIAATLAIEPRHFGAVSGFGQICLRDNRLGEALAAFQVALAINPHLQGLREAVAELGETRLGRLH
jgi:tetratricopeptide (TPR) repeat protein